MASVSELKKAGTFYGKDHKMRPISWESAIDIDDMEDLLMAKAVWILKNENNIPAVMLLFI